MQNNEAGNEGNASKRRADTSLHKLGCEIYV